MGTAHGNALAQADHEVQSFLLGEATPLPRTALMEAVHQVG